MKTVIAVVCSLLHVASGSLAGAAHVHARGQHTETTGLHLDHTHARSHVAPSHDRHRQPGELGLGQVEHPESSPIYLFQHVVRPVHDVRTAWAIVCMPLMIEAPAEATAAVLDGPSPPRAPPHEAQLRLRGPPA